MFLKNRDDLLDDVETIRSLSSWCGFLKTLLTTAASFACTTSSATMVFFITFTNRLVSWNVSRSWSASRQLQAIGSNLVAPRANEIVATNGLEMLTYTMGIVLLFLMWALMAAIPCQDRGLQVQFYLPMQFSWAATILSLLGKIMEESRKKDRKNSCGLLMEIH
ncbi:uncharacterized protein LOC120180693 [Hibiscus syriacus]|uniref:uncharacterized protein LOC120180693 n=1 Tax=Hibiscus syriacus TaxID=106335 RepID=UPI001925155D|nr:uncharacterized protein LOC120180693 [Hibiscus syriacus]